MKFALAALLLASSLPLFACDGDTSSFRLDAARPDAGPEWDGTTALDGPRADGMGTDGLRADTEMRDSFAADAVGGDGASDARSPDASVDTRSPDASVDTRSPDASVDTLSPDASVDTLSPDVTTDTSSPPAGLSVPCQLGPGWTLFRFHYDSGSTSARIDVWDASCSYSFAPNSACNVRTVYPGFGDVGTTSEGYPILTTSEYMRVRFSVAGLNFSRAAVYVRARSYATSSSTYYRVWSPLYGDQEGGPVDNDWVYDWYGLDWSDYLSPLDQPSLTAIQIYASRGSGSLAVRAVELCVQ